MGKKRKQLIGKVITYGLLLLFSFLFLLPFLWMLRSSLMRMDQIFIIPPVIIPKPVRWENYSEAMTFIHFGRYYLNTFFIVIMTVTGTVLTSALAAFSFSRLKWKYRNLIFNILLTSMMLPFAVTMIPMFIGWKTVGAIDTYIPLIVPAWFGGGAYNIFLLRQLFSTIPGAYDEAARIDGASSFYIFSRIIVPLGKPGLVVVAMFSFIGCWNDFLGPLIYLNSEMKYTVALGLRQFSGTYNAQWGLLMAASTVAILPTLIIFFFGQKYIIGGISVTGVKG